MFIPVEPNSVSGIWDKLQRSLSEQSLCLVVSDGKQIENPADTRLSTDEATDLIDKLKSRDHVRVGTIRTEPTPSHFSINLDGNNGELMEFVAMSSDKERIRKDLSLVLQFTFFEIKDIGELLIPLIVEGLEDPELKIVIDTSANATKAYRL